VTFGSGASRREGVFFWKERYVMFLVLIFLFDGIYSKLVFVFREGKKVCIFVPFSIGSFSLLQAAEVGILFC
jgi:hypothetical protein